jgi:hypothetical protein
LTTSADADSDAGAAPAEPDARGRIIYAFEAQAGNELTVAVGEMVVVVEKRDHGQLCA